MKQQQQKTLIIILFQWVNSFGVQCSKLEVNLDYLVCAWCGAYKLLAMIVCIVEQDKMTVCKTLFSPLLPPSHCILLHLIL